MALRLGGLNNADKHAFNFAQCISNELTSPKVLVCPSDTRTRATTWEPNPATGVGYKDNNNISYFFSEDADETRPQTILSGDRNIKNTNNRLAGDNATVSMTDAQNANTGNGPNWDSDQHNRNGNLGLGDGSAQQCNEQQLKRQIVAAIQSIASNTNTYRFSLPQ